jgi:Ca2+-binding RTX toxin-like protein
LTICLAGMLGALALASDVQPARAATTVDVDDCGFGDVGRPPACEPSVYIQADRGPNDIMLHWNNAQTRFTLTDSLAKVIAPDCRQVTGHRANCPYPANPHDNLAISGRDGDDRISVGTFPSTGLGPELIGGPGRDVISGGPLEDFIYGGMGADIVWGFAGDDFITGGGGNFVKHERPSPDALHGGSGDDEIGDAYDKGPDSSFGGAGKDRIHASEGSVDEQIVGGKGEDRCHIDQRRDPGPRQCETVKGGPGNSKNA